MRQGAAVAEQGTLSTASDAALVAATLGSGGSTAFGELVRRYKGMVMGRVYAITGDWHEAEDLAQDAFVRAYRALGQLQRPSEFGSWLGVIARNLARTSAARRRPASLEGVASAGDGDGDGDAGIDSIVPPETADPREAASRRELYERVVREIESLPESYRSTVYLRYLKGRSCREIAEIEGVSTGVVTSRLTRASAALREKLAPLAGEGLR